MREYYFGHLTDVLMVDSRVLAAERPGGADYDGDMVKTIASPSLTAVYIKIIMNTAET